MIESLAHMFSEVFAPEYFVLLCGVTLILYEWSHVSSTGIRGLVARFGVLVLGWIVAFVIYKGGPALFKSAPPWATDFAGSLGLAVGIVLIGVVWYMRGWGRLVTEFSLWLVAVTVPHLVITPFWDISSHVLYAATPAGYLALVDRRFGPYLLVPLGMVVSRPLAGAHTWLQSIGGLFLACLFIVGLYYMRGLPKPHQPRETASNNTITRI